MYVLFILHSVQFKVCDLQQRSNTRTYTCTCTIYMEYGMSISLVHSFIYLAALYLSPFGIFGLYNVNVSHKFD